MSLREKLSQGKFVVTAELGPPKGVDVTRALAEARAMGPVDAMNVTDLQGGVMKLGSIALSRILIEQGIEPVFQLTAASRNRLAVQSDVLSAYVLGIRNVLLLGGDPPKVGDHPDAKPVYDLDTMGLFGAVKSLKGGRDLAGKELEGSPKDIFVGGAANPVVEDLETERQKTLKKIELGCEFFQTQAVFDPALYEKFLEKVKGVKQPFLAGVILLKSAKMAKFMNDHIPGIRVPEALIQEIDGVPDKDKKKKSVEIAVRLLRALKPLVQGFHIMPIGWGELIPEILEGAGISKNLSPSPVR
ncbi:MAG: methylenetetrahydrofolate reductase [Candidatus Omnitrophica bacterium]|nr:methylenetetrahydrofolate reductase [Candidatus Omnitrophota bacterium]